MLQGWSRRPILDGPSSRPAGPTGVVTSAHCMDVRCANVLLGGWFDGIASYQVRAYSPIHLIVNEGQMPLNTADCPPPSYTRLQGA